MYPDPKLVGSAREWGLLLKRAPPLVPPLATFAGGLAGVAHSLILDNCKRSALKPAGTACTSAAIANPGAFTGATMHMAGTWKAGDAVLLAVLAAPQGELHRRAPAEEPLRISTTNGQGVTRVRNSTATSSCATTSTNHKQVLDNAVSVNRKENTVECKRSQPQVSNSDALAAFPSHSQVQSSVHF
jgi:hypothetical protein